MSKPNRGRNRGQGDGDERGRGNNGRGRGNFRHGRNHGNNFGGSSNNNNVRRGGDQQQHQQHQSNANERKAHKNDGIAYKNIEQLCAEMDAMKILSGSSDVLKFVQASFTFTTCKNS